MASKSITSEEFRAALGHFATGVTVLTAERRPDSVHGMTANSLASVSLEPPMILVCIAENAQMLGLLRKHRRFGVNILRAGQTGLSRFFSQPEQPLEDERRLGIRFRWTPGGIPLLEDALAQLECRVVADHVAGDHTIFVAQVERARISSGDPLLYYRCNYRKILPES